MSTALRAYSRHSRFGVVSIRPEPRGVEASVALRDEVLQRMKHALANSMYQQPLLPSTVMKALKAANSPNSSMRDIARIIRVDPGLAAEVLRTANSGYYLRGARIVTLHQALARVGIAGLRELLLVASGGRVLRVPGDSKFGDRLRRRSMAVAFAGKMTASYVRADKEQAFAAGLLHDVGLAAFYSLYRGIKRKMPALRRAGLATRDRLAGELHEEVGAILARNWELPAPVAGAMGHHHRPDEAVTGIQMATIIGAARYLVTTVGGLVDPVDDEPDVTPLNRLRLSEEAENRLRGDIRRLFEGKKK